MVGYNIDTPVSVARNVAASLYQSTLFAPWEENGSSHSF